MEREKSRENQTLRRGEQREAAQRAGGGEGQRQKLRALTGQTMLLSLGQLLGNFSTIGLTAVLTRCMTMEAYAQHKQALLIYVICAPLLSLGLPRALYFFLSSEERRPRGIFYETLSLLGLLSLLFAGLLFAGGLAAVAEYFQQPVLVELALPLAIYGAASLIQSTFAPTMMSRQRAKALVLFQSCAQLLRFAAVALTAWISGEAWATIWSCSLASAGIALGGIALNLHTLPRSAEDRPSPESLKEQLRYAVPLGLSGMLGALSIQVDKYIVSSSCSAEEFAVYITGALELPLIAVVVGSMNTVIFPHLVKAYRAGDLNQILSLWQGSMGQALLLLLPATGAVLLCGEELIALAFSERYRAAAVPFRIYALSLPLRAAVYSSILMATDRTRWITGCTLFSLLTNLSLNLLFVPALGSEGAAWATVLTNYLTVLLMTYSLSRALARSPLALFDWTLIGRTLVAATLPGLICWWALQHPALRALGDFTRLCLAGAVYGGLVLIGYRIFGLATIRELIGLLRRRAPR